MTSPVRALVAGAGLMGTWHAHSIRRTGGAVVGVVDPDLPRVTALAARHRGARPFRCLEDALKALAPDIVHVCTPLESHVSLVRTALVARCHVLVEKPLAATAEETRDLLTLANKVGRMLTPVHQFVWQRGALQLAGRLADLGPILHVEASAASAGAIGGSAATADAVAADILPHFLALTRRFLDIPLADQHWAVEKSRAGEWSVTARCGTVTVHFLVSMAARPTFAELRLLGERGSARLDLFHGFGVFEGGTVSRMAKAARPFRVAANSLSAASRNLALRVIQQEPAYPGLTELVRRVHLAAIGRGDGPIPPAEILDIAKTRDLLITLAGRNSMG